MTALRERHEKGVDVACGTGVIARHAAPMLGSAGSIVGVDLSARMLEVAATHAPTDGASVEWKQGNGSRATRRLCRAGMPTSMCAVPTGLAVLSG